MDGDSDRQYDSGSETLFDKFDYTYTLDGSRASETRSNADGATTIEWTYDGLNRLISEEFSGFDGQGDALAYTDTYSFDLASNRTKLVHDDQTSGGGGSAGPDSTTTYEYDANDRLLAETRDVAGGSSADRHTVYGYGPTDQTSKTVHEGLDDTGDVVEDVEFIYDATGRMTGVTMTLGSTTTTVTYKYDHNGFRVEATVDDGTNPPVTTIFHVDPANPTGYAQVVEQGVDADSDGRLDASEIEKAFVIGLDLITQATASALLHLLTDAHGSTKAVLNAATSSVVERYVYSAYGLDLGLVSSPATAFRYAGEFIDPITGLSFNRARWYDPSSGRWNQLDLWYGNTGEPATLHKYGYTHANPVSNTDPSGLSSLTNMIVTMGLMALVTGIYNIGVVLAVSYNVGRAVDRSGQVLPDGIIFNFGLGYATGGGTGGIILSLYFDRQTLRPYVFITAEGGLAPVSRFKTRRGGSRLFTVGGVWNVRGIEQLSGFSFTATWPRALGRFMVPSPVKLSTMWSHMMNLARYEKGVGVKDRQGVIQFAQSFSGPASVAYGLKTYTYSATTGYTSPPIDVVSLAATAGDDAAALVNGVLAEVTPFLHNLDDFESFRQVYNGVLDRFDAWGED